MDEQQTRYERPLGVAIIFTIAEVILVLLFFVGCMDPTINMDWHEVLGYALIVLTFALLI